MAKYFDIHSHLFNKNFLAKELLYRLLKEVKKLLNIEKGDDRGLTDWARNIKKVIQALKRYSYAIKVFTRQDSTAIYEEIDKTYKGDFILTPLTFDLTYCFAPSADRSAGPEPTVKEVFEREMNTMFEIVEQSAQPLSRDFNSTASAEDEALWQEYQQEKARFMENAAELQTQHEQNISRSVSDRGIVELPDAFDGFQEQIRQMIELKNNAAYKDMIFPFLAIDPRRPGIAEYAKANVGKGKLFIGVKLYCPTGFSPTDPLLFGPDGEKGGIYAFCEENGIPVTVHNSDGGFATLSKSVKVSGHIQFNNQLIKLDNEMLTFKTSIMDKDAIKERAFTLNHPLIWEKVAEKYPNLLLNLAHFGGGKQLDAALDAPADIDLWSNRIIALLKNPAYHVYTDLSCYSDMDVMRKFRASAVYQEIKTRTLYGSDYILLLLFENDFNRNVDDFKNIFGSDFDIIAGSNPREFLRHVLDI